jgi:hypothetical protein
MSKILLSFGLAIVGAAVVAGGAAADGLPVLGVDVSMQGVAVHGGPARYLTVSEGLRGTIVEQTATAGGSIMGLTRLHGTFTIPAVAYDGSASGLSGDGTTLVLIEPRASFPRARTRFAVLDALPLLVRRVVTLRGDFSFDAISPDGGTMFLIQYVSATDPTRYHVRAYDLRSWRLLPQPVVDSREHEGAMRGSPLSRATSTEGRWAYTLYDGAGGTPFVHALDTTAREARCIDLPLLAGLPNLSQLRLRLHGRTLSVVAAGQPLALVYTRSWRVTAPSRPEHDRPWWPLAVGGGGSAALAVLLALAVRRRRNHPAQAGAGEMLVSPTMTAAGKRAWQRTRAMRTAITSGAPRSRPPGRARSRSSSRPS